jgi:hypothetical protein
MTYIVLEGYAMARLHRDLRRQYRAAEDVDAVFVNEVNVESKVDALGKL